MNIQIPKIVFIVPYRNREKEKLHFSVYMRYIMEDYDDKDYEIYYSHQCDTRPFNRGATKNIGFLAIKNKYPDDYKNITFVFNDIDTIPASKNLFSYETKSGEVKHFYGFKFSLGGIFSIIGEDFEKCGGFSNNWGWGLEDNIMQKHVLEKNIKINREQFYPLNSKEIIHLYDSPYRLINNRDPANYSKNKIYDTLNKIHNLKIDIENNIENSSINSKNEFIINIKQFNTLINSDNEIFYNQNIQKNTKLRTNFYENTVRKQSWNMNRFLNMK
jgi:hypothetical protein